MWQLLNAAEFLAQQAANADKAAAARASAERTPALAAR
jgi:hypothetical protein